MANTPPFSLMLWNYPAGTPDEVKTLIGGNVNASWITNTCAIRLSRSLNYSGVPVPRHFVDMNVVSGDDHKWYAFRVREMKRWLTHKLGAPDIDATSPVDRSQFSGVRGVIGFDIHFPDATGHLDLWDGSTYIHEAVDPRDYFSIASRVVLWASPYGP